MNTLRYAGQTDRGLVRQRNEDNWLVWLEKGLFIVSDGMGGHAGGQVASTIVVQTLSRLLEQRLGDVGDWAAPAVAQTLTAALVDLSNRVRDESRQQPGLVGMGATVVVVLIREAQALLAHLGDSRAYRWRDGHLEQLTVDHSIVQLLIDTGEITREEATVHPARGQVTRYVGMEGEALPETRLLVLSPGDRLLLCSDGLTDMVADGELVTQLQAHPEPHAACRALIDAAKTAGGRDNITVLVIDYSG